MPRAAKPMNVPVNLTHKQADLVLGTLFDLGSALVERGHKWSRKEKAAWGRSVRLLTAHVDKKKPRRKPRKVFTGGAV